MARENGSEDMIWKPGGRRFRKPGGGDASSPGPAKMGGMPAGLLIIFLVLGLLLWAGEICFSQGKAAIAASEVPESGLPEFGPEGPKFKSVDSIKAMESADITILENPPSAGEICPGGICP